MCNISANYRRIVSFTVLPLLLLHVRLRSVLQLHAELQEGLVQAVDLFLHTEYLQQRSCCCNVRRTVTILLKIIYELEQEPLPASVSLLVVNLQKLNQTLLPHNGKKAYWIKAYWIEVLMASMSMGKSSSGTYNNTVYLAETQSSIGFIIALLVIGMLPLKSWTVCSGILDHYFRTKQLLWWQSRISTFFLSPPCFV